MEQHGSPGTRRPPAEPAHQARDLVDLGALAEGSLEIQRRHIALADVLERAIAACQRQIDATGHRLRVMLPPSSLLVEADAERLERVFGILLRNAVRFTPAPGELRISARRDNGCVLISVLDSGIGIAGERIEQLFDRAAASVGLRLVQGLVELHGGTVEAHSDGPGTGSEFRVRLPVVAAAERPASRGRASARCRVLVVDDSIDSANSLAILLRICGAEVEACFSGSEALSRLDAFQPAAVFLDLSMPVMDGYEVARRIRESHGDGLRLIAMTGWGAEDVRESAREAGFDHHLVKPAEIETLRTLLDTLDGTQPLAH